MLEVLERLSQRIIQREEDLRRRALDVRSRHPDAFIPVSPKPYTGSVAAVDGGMLSRNYHGMDILMVRAVGVLFRYVDGVLRGVEYFPSPMPDPHIEEHYLPAEEDQVGALRSLVRLRAEIRRAVEMVESFEPDILFLDGSVLPLLADRPKVNGEQSALYKEVIRLYQELFDVCGERGVLLAGIVKDSKGNRLATFLGEAEYLRVSDTRWLSYALFPGERTISVPYADDPSARPTLKDVGVERTELVRVFYLRASAYDAPYRVEYVEREGEEDEVLASMLLPLSALSPTYTLPPFLLEADLRARLGKREMEYLNSLLERRIGIYYNFMRMRGASKPW